MTDLDRGKISDGYHTFDELYRHRSVLFVALMWDRWPLSWYSAYRSDGTMFDGMFIAGMSLPTGQITYHLEIDPWWDLMERTACVKLDSAMPFDGHTSDDVINRIIEWIVL